MINIKSRNGRVLTFIFIWFIYSTIVSVFGSNGAWKEEKSDGWYLFYERCETDDAGENCWPVIIDGPFTEAEIDNKLLEFEKEANEFMKKYGTVYNLRFEEDNGFFIIINLVLYASYLFGIPYLIYFIFYEKSAK